MKVYLLFGVTSIIHWFNLNMFLFCLNMSSYYSFISLLNLSFSLINEMYFLIFFIFAHLSLSHFFSNSVEIRLTSLQHFT